MLASFDVRALLLACFVSFAALADGAFPNASQVLTRTGDPQRVELGVTFGLASTADDGAHWHYVCEPYVTGSVQSVVLYALQADGALLALSANSLTRSTDQGCTWSGVAPPGSGSNWMDVFADPAEATRTLGIAWTTTHSGVWLSSDGARTFPAQLLDSTERIDSVESAASDPRVIYATTAVFELPDAGAGPVGLFRSVDGGAGWERNDLPMGPPVAVRILAVSPEDPKTLWLRASYFLGSFDELFVSTDGGRSVTSLLRAQKAFTGFAHAGDGTLFLADGDAGLLVRAPGAAGFTRLPGPHLLCLFRAGTRLYGCTDGSKEPYNLAFSDDAGRSWTPFFSLTLLEGPATCPQVVAACADDWTAQQKFIAASLKPQGPSCGCRTAEPGGWLWLAALFLRRRMKAGLGSRSRQREPSSLHRRTVSTKHWRRDSRSRG
jgi:hypothetical protein